MDIFPIFMFSPLYELDNCQISPSEQTRLQWAQSVTLYHAHHSSQIALLQLSEFQETEFQLTEFQETEFQETEFQLTEFQLTVPQVI